MAAISNENPLDVEQEQNAEEVDVGSSDLLPRVRSPDSDDDYEESSCTPEEEQFRQLFTSCDSDGDGFIDSKDLASMCKQLNMEDSIEEIVTQFGVKDNGRLSFDDFLNCRMQFMGEIDELRKVMDQDKEYHKSSNFLTLPTMHTQSAEPGVAAYGEKLYATWPSHTSNINNLDISSGKHDSWEFDSGAHDLSPEPNSLHKMIETAGGNLTTDNRSSLLDLANNLHLGALASLKQEVFELSTKLQHLSQDRDTLERQLNKAQLERLQLARHTDDRLDQQSQRYEERITELHGVIAELSKKLNHQQSNIIREEDEGSHHSDEYIEEEEECSGSRPSQIASNDNNPNESCSERDTDDVNPELSMLVSDLNASDHMLQSSMNASQQTIVDYSPQSSDNMKLAQQQTSDDSPRPIVDTSCVQNLQIYQLQVELQTVRTENEQLHERVNQQQIDLGRTQSSVGNIRDERDRLKRKIREMHSKFRNNCGSTQDINQQVIQSTNTSTTASPVRSKSPRANPTTGERTPTSREDQQPITKIAERVRLKKMDAGDRQILGSEISSIGISSTKVAEHLVQHLQDESNAQEILQTICSSGSNISECKVKEFEVETERLNSKIDHLKSQNDLLSITFEECRNQCDRLSVLIGKYESNNTALQLAVGYSDRCLEALEVLVALLESEQGLLLANCHAAGLSGLVKGQRDDEHGEVTVLLKRANENRKSAEALARHLLQRLDRDCSMIYTGFAIIPWEDVSSHNNSSKSSGSVDLDFSKGDEQRLRDYINQLKKDRNLVQTTVMQLESIYVDPLENALSLLDSQKLDLENAVLMQDLMAIKEEKAELKAQVYLLEKEKSALELRLNTKEAQEMAYKLHVEHLKAEIQDNEQIICRLRQSFPSLEKICQNDFSFDVQSIIGEIPQDMIEALRREKKLKGRIQELVTTLDKVIRNSELRHQQSADFVKDLKGANTAIIGAFERSKKKHQTKLKKIEQQMLAMMERHNNEVKALQGKIGMLEGDRSMSTRSSETTL